MPPKALHSTETSDDPTLSLRRVYVPAEQVPELGKQFPELIRMSRAEFDALVEQARAATSQLPRVDVARYSGRFDGHRLTGSAKLTVRGRASEQSLLRWPVGRVAFRDARWHRQDSDTPENDTAVLGCVGRNEMVLLVPAGGDVQTLDLAWSAFGRVIEPGSRFELRLPPAMRGELELDLPSEFVPVAAGAWISDPAATARSDDRRWLLRWSPGDSLNLLISRSVARQPSPFVVYDSEFEMEVGEEESELLARFNVRPVHGEIWRLEFEASQGLKPFDWSGIKVRDWMDRGDRLVIELAEPLVEPSQMTIRALGPGAAQGVWRSPRLEIAGGVWTGGRTRVRASAGFELHDVHADRGRVSLGLDNSGNAAEWQIEHAATDAHVQAHLATHAAQVFSEVHSTLTMGSRAAATASVSWRVAQGEINVLRLRVPAGWVVENIEGLGPNQLGRWSVDTEGGADQILYLRLSRSLLAGSTLSAMVHLSGPDIEMGTQAPRLAVPRLLPLGVHAANETVSVVANSPWATELAESIQLTPIAASDSGVATVEASATSYRFDGPAAGGVLVLRRQQPELSAASEVQVAVGSDHVQARYTLSAEFLGGQADWFEVQFHAPTEGNLRWELPSGFRVEPLSGGAGIPETWRVVLPFRAPRNVRIIAKWNGVASANVRVPLATISQASAWSGRVQLVAPVALSIKTEGHGLDPMPSVGGGAPVGERSEHWQYGLDQPRLELEVASVAAIARAMPRVDHVEIETELSVRGDAIHRVRLRFGGPNEGVVAVTLPEGSELRRATGTQTTPQSSLPLEWNLAESGSLADFEYSVSRGRWARWTSLDLPLPRFSVPVMRTSWRVRLPDGFQVVAWSDGWTASPPSSERSALERLFGPLARTSSRSFFAFWRGDAWRTWWNDSPSSSARDTLVVDVARDFLRDSRDADRTWARLIQQLDQASGRRVVIDTLALTAVSLHQPIPSGRDVSAVLQGFDELPITLLQGEQAVIVTSSHEASALAELGTAGLPKRLASRGNLAQAVAEALSHGVDSSGRFAMASVWTAAIPHVAKMPSEPVRRERPAGPVARFESGGETTSLSIHVVQQLIIYQLVGLVVGLIAIAWLAMTGGLSRVRVVVLGFGIALAFLLGLTLPALVAAPAVVGFWGQLLLLASWSWSNRLDHRRVVHRDGGVRLPSAVSQAGAAGAIILILVGWAPAMESPQQPQGARPLLVLIPYDPAHPERRDEATTVLVPQETLARLRERARPAAMLGEVLVISGQHSARVVEDRVNLVLEFELYSLGEQSRCLLPISGIVVSAALLDGEACLLQQESGGFAAEVTGAGPHRLRIEGAAALDPSVARGVVELGLPPSPEASLQIERPAGLQLEIEPALSEWRADLPSLDLNIGALDRLALRWASGQQAAPQVRTESASVLTWTPASARLESRIQVQVESGATSRFVIPLDDSLILESVRAPGLGGYWVRRDGDRTALVMEFDRPIDRTIIAVDSWIRLDATDRIAVPRLSVEKASSRRHIVAVRGEMNELNVVEPETTGEATSDDLRIIWGEPIAATQTVLQLPDSAERVVFDRVDQRPPRILQVQSQLQIVPGRIALASRFTAEAQGQALGHEMLLPPNFSLTDVRAAEGTHWRSVAPDRLLWFGSSADLATLEVTGWVPADSGSVLMPAVRPAGQVEVRGEIALWRSSSLQVAMMNGRGLVLKGQKPERPSASNLVGESLFGIEASDYGAELEIKALAPRLSATVATRVVADAGHAEWIAVVDYQINGGPLRAMRLQVPSSLKAVQMSGQAIRDRAVQTNGDHATWSVQLLEPRWNNYRLILKSRLDVADDGSVRVPIVTPQLVDTVQQHLLVMNASDREIVVAGSEGFEPTSADAFKRWFAEPVAGRLAAAYSGAHGSVSIRAVQGVAAPSGPSALLERHVYWFRDSGPATAKTVLLVQASAAGELPIELPAEATLVELLVDGERVRWPVDSAGRPRLHFDASARPREVMLSWQWNHTGASGDSVVLPRLTGSNGPRLYTVALDGSRPKWNETSPTCASDLAVEQARVLGEQVNRALGTVRSADPTGVVWDLERSFLSAVGAARRALEMDAENMTVQRAHADHDRSARLLAATVAENREALEAAGLSSLLGRADAQSHRLAPPIGRMLLAEMCDLPSRDQSLLLPLRGRVFHTIAPKGEPAAFTRTRTESIGREIVRLIARGLIGVAIALACLLLAQVRWRHFVMTFVLAAAGCFWCWALEPEPVGPLLLLTSVVMLFAGWRYRVRHLAARESPVGAA